MQKSEKLTQNVRLQQLGHMHVILLQYYLTEIMLHSACCDSLSRGRCLDTQWECLTTYEHPVLT